MKRQGVVWACVMAAAAALPALPAPAQTVFLCEGEGRSLVFSGAGATPPECRALADPSADLLLGEPQPDLAALARDVAALARRVSRLEALQPRLPAPRSAPLAPVPRPDPYDTRGRMRDLGQDLDRRLDGSGR